MRTLMATISPSRHWRSISLGPHSDHPVYAADRGKPSFFKYFCVRRSRRCCRCNGSMPFSFVLLTACSSGGKTCCLACLAVGYCSHRHSVFPWNVPGQLQMNFFSGVAQLPHLISPPVLSLDAARACLRRTKHMEKE